MLMPKRSRIEGIVRQESLQIYCHVLVHFSGRVFPEKPGGGGGGVYLCLEKLPRSNFGLCSFWVNLFTRPSSKEMARWHVSRLPGPLVDALKVSTHVTSTIM